MPGKPNHRDGLAPPDKRFGAWRDGAPEAEALMNARFERRRARANA